MARNASWANNPKRHTTVCQFKYMVGPHKGHVCNGEGHTTAHHVALWNRAMRTLKAKSTSPAHKAKFNQVRATGRPVPGRVRLADSTRRNPVSSTKVKGRAPAKAPALLELPEVRKVAGGVLEAKGERADRYDL